LRNAGVFEHALSQLRLRSASVRLDDDKRTVLHIIIICPDERERSLRHDPRQTFHLTDSRFIICCMSNPNQLAGIVPRSVHEVKDGETTITEYVEKIEGEVALDTYVKAQTSAPEVVKRVTELENSLQRLASAVLTSSDVQKHPELRAAAEEAKLVLKNRLKVDETKHRFNSELGTFKDVLGISKD
jgi:hypothetical protein